MIRGTRIAIVLGAVAVLASGCGTDGGTPLSPEVKPAFDVGGGLGMGGNVTGDGGTTTESQSTQAAPGSGGLPTEEEPSDSTSRSGYGMGGN